MADSMDTDYEITVAQKLCDWGLEDLVQTFEDNAVDGETFLELDEATLKELIPKLGQRMKFKNAAARFKKEMNMEGGGDGNGQVAQTAETETRPKRSGSSEESSVQSKRPRGDGPKRTFRILIYTKNVGKIIGKGGATIKGLRQSHKANVAIADGSNEAVLSIIAQQDDAINCLMETVPTWDEYKGKEGAGNDLDVEISMLVHFSHAGTIIGRSGYQINDLKKKHNCTINITKEQLPNSTDQTCTVIGKLSKVAECLRDIDTIIQAVPIRGHENNYNPSHQEMEYQQGYGMDDSYGSGAMGGGGGGYGGSGGYGGGSGSYGGGGYGSGGSGGYGGGSGSYGGGGGYGSGGSGGYGGSSGYGGGYGGGGSGGYGSGGGRMGGGYGGGAGGGRGMGGGRGGGMRGGGGRGQKRGFQGRGGQY